VIRLLVAVPLIAAACTTVATVPSVASISPDERGASERQ